MGSIPATFTTALREGAGRCRLLWLLMTALVYCGTATAAGPFQPCGIVLPVDQATPGDSLDGGRPEQHLSRALAAGLALTLGPFGAHRLYLGTTPKVPLLYGLTFGGFGVLVLIDLGHILFTRDLSAYQDSRQVLMWAKPDGAAPVTPP